MSTLRRIYRLRRFDRPESQKLRNIQIWWTQRHTAAKYRTPEYPNRKIMDIHGTALRRRARSLHFLLFVKMIRPYKRTRRSRESILKFIMSLLFIAFVPSLFVCSCSSVPLRDSPVVPKTILQPSDSRELHTQGDRYTDVQSRKTFQYWHDAGWLAVSPEDAKETSSPIRSVSPSSQSKSVSFAQVSSSAFRAVRIEWDSSPESDLKRYWIKRFDNVSTMPLLVADLVTTPALSYIVENPGFDAPVVKAGKVCGFIDAQLDPARIYNYSVFAVDISGNVSLPALFNPDGTPLRARFIPLASPANVKIFVIYP